MHPPTIRTCVGLCLSASLLVIASCSKPQSPVSLAAAPPAAAADEAARTLAKGLADHQPVALWDALPASYQQDVTGMVREFAAEVDPELWKRSFASGHKLVEMLKAKRRFIFGNTLVSGALQFTDESEVEAGWDALVDMLAAVIQSDLADPEKLRSFDGRAFFATTGPALMKGLARLSALTEEDELNRFVSEHARAKYSLLSTGAERAIVKRALPGKEPEERIYVKLEGKWLPKEFTDQWAENFPEFRDSVVSLTPDDSPKAKGALLQLLPMVDGLLDRLAAATTQDEFDVAVRDGLLTFGGSASGLLVSLGLHAFDSLVGK